MTEARHTTGYRLPPPAGPERSIASERRTGANLAAATERPPPAMERPPATERPPGAERAPSATERPSGGERASGADRPEETGTDAVDGGRTLVKVTVNLTPRAVEALDQTCTRTRDSKTDTINRALVVYQLVLELMDRGGGQLTFQDRDGRTERIHLL